MSHQHHSLNEPFFFCHCLVLHSKTVLAARLRRRLRIHLRIQHWRRAIRHVPSIIRRPGTQARGGLNGSRALTSLEPSALAGAVPAASFAS